MKDLIQIIKDNPNCVATIDNDYWVLEKISRFSEDAPNEEKIGYDAYSEWEKENELAHSNNIIKSLGDGGYGPGNCYGGDILQALAVIVGIKIEGV